MLMKTAATNRTLSCKYLMIWCRMNSTALINSWDICQITKKFDVLFSDIDRILRICVNRVDFEMNSLSHFRFYGVLNIASQISINSISNHWCKVVDFAKFHNFRRHDWDNLKFPGLTVMPPLPHHFSFSWKNEKSQILNERSEQNKVDRFGNNHFRPQKNSRMRHFVQIIDVCVFASTKVLRPSNFII